MAPLFQQPFMSGGFPSMNRAVAGAVGGWVELGRVSLSGDSQTISGLADKRYLMLLTHSIPSGNAETGYQFNSDTGTNYAYRYSQNGSEYSGGSINHIPVYGEATPTKPNFSVGYVANYSSKEKLYLSHTVASTTSATNSPIRFEMAHKWANTSNSISSVTTMDKAASGSFGSGETVVLGWDPADSHTNNFWEELASVQGTGSSNVLDSGVFTPKKYLWIQQFTSYGGSGNINPQLQVGYNTIDTGNNYSIRYNEDGGADGTITSYSHMGFHYVGSTSVYPSFSNTFIINNASNEKLAIMHTNDATGSGAGTAPSRMESVSKWANTSNQINRVQFTNVGNVSTNSWLKVWGAD